MKLIYWRILVTKKRKDRKKLNMLVYLNSDLLRSPVRINDNKNFGRLGFPKMAPAISPLYMLFYLVTPLARGSVNVPPLLTYLYGKQ